MDDAIKAEIRLAMPDDMEGAFALRRAIFIGEQNVDPEEEWDGRDDAAVHVVAVMGEEIVGTGRLLIDEGETTCRIGRMAVRQNLRRHGIGDGILTLLESAARERGFRQALLHAQTYVKEFYAQAGYTEQGEVFMEAGHRAHRHDKGPNPRPLATLSRRPTPRASKPAPAP